MPTLMLLRHAKAEPAAKGGKDFDRRLAKRGRSDAQAIARQMAEDGRQPDRVLLSPAARTRETLDEVLPPLAPVDDVRELPELFDATGDDVLALIRAQGDGANALLVLGHNPSIHEAAAMLIGKPPSPFAAELKTKFPTSGLAVFEFDGEWAGLKPKGARLVDFVTPENLIGD